MRRLLVMLRDRLKNLAAVPDPSLRHLLHPALAPVLPGVEGPPELPQRPRGDDPRWAWALAGLSHLVYCSRAVAEARAMELGVEILGWFEVGGSRALLAGWGGQRILACCGTRPEEIDNLLHDGDLRWQQDAAGRLHRGFVQHWQGLRPLLQQAVAGSPEQPLWLTGHSLGGAMAILAARDLPSQGVVAFGCPRIGDRRWVAAWQGPPVHRWHNACDIIGHLPPRWLRFVHLGELLFLPAAGGMLRNPGVLALRRAQISAEFAYFLSGRWAGGGRVPARWLVDHAITNYVAVLDRLHDAAA